VAVNQFTASVTHSTIVLGVMNASFDLRKNLFSAKHIFTGEKSGEWVGELILT
jgi:hypothetical protein